MIKMQHFDNTSQPSTTCFLVACDKFAQYEWNNYWQFMYKNGQKTPI